MKKTKFIIALTMAVIFLTATVSQAWITRVKNWLIVDSEITGGSITGIDIELQNGATISEAVNGTVAISDNVDIETDLEVGDDITRNSKPVPTCEDAASPSAKPLIQHGSGVGGSEDGTITFHREFGAVPTIVMTVSEDDSVDTQLHSAHVKTRTVSGFTYEIRKSVSGTITDVTTSETVFYIAVGHE